MSTDAFDLLFERALRKGVDFRFRTSDGEDGITLEMKVRYLDAETSWVFEDTGFGARGSFVEALEAGINHVTRWEAAGPG